MKDKKKLLSRRLKLYEMKKLESLNSKKFKLTEKDKSIVKGGWNFSAGTGECHGTGCSERTGTTGAFIDWEDVECGETVIPGSVKCPPTIAVNYQ